LVVTVAFEWPRRAAISTAVGDSGVSLCGRTPEVAMVMRWVKSLVRRVRIVRYQRREVEREMQDRRSAEHVERVRNGIKEPQSNIAA
jgi:hypothetical protein